MRNKCTLHLSQRSYGARNDRLCAAHHCLVGLLARVGKVVGPLLVGRLDDGCGLPQVGGEHVVGALEGVVGGLQEVTHGLGVALSGSVAIVDTSVANELLGHGRADQTGTAGGRDETHTDGTALAGDFSGYGVGVSELVTPVSTTNGDDGELGIDDTTADGSGNFLGALLAETDVTVEVTNDDEGLEASALSGTGLLLNGHDLHDLILDVLAEEVVNDLALLDGEGVEEDLLQRLHLAITNETAEAGAWGPHLLLVTTAGTAGATTATSAVTALTAATTTSKTTAESTALARRSCICHY